MKRLSRDAKEKVVKLLPELRQEVIKDFMGWDCHPTLHILSDKNVLALLPIAAHDYLTITKELELNSTLIMYVLNKGLVTDLRPIVYHTLRILVMMQKVKE